MTDARTIPRGVPCWIDVEPPDRDAAVAFYGGLFGWTFENAMPPGLPGYYLIARLDGQDVAGLGPPAPTPDAVLEHVRRRRRRRRRRRVRWPTRAGRSRARPRTAGRPAGVPPFARPGRRAVPRVWQARPPTRRAARSTRRGPGTSATCAPPTRRAARTFYGAVFGWEADALDPGRRRPGDVAAPRVRRPPGGDDRPRHPPTARPRCRPRPGFADAIGWLAPVDGRRAAPLARHVRRRRPRRRAWRRRLRLGATDLSGPVDSPVDPGGDGARARRAPRSRSASSPRPRRSQRVAAVGEDAALVHRRVQA